MIHKGIHFLYSLLLKIGIRNFPTIRIYLGSLIFIFKCILLHDIYIHFLRRNTVQIWWINWVPKKLHYLPVAPKASRHSKGFRSSAKAANVQNISCLEESTIIWNNFTLPWLPHYFILFKKSENKGFLFTVQSILKRSLIPYCVLNSMRTKICETKLWIWLPSTSTHDE